MDNDIVRLYKNIKIKHCIIGQSGKCIDGGIMCYQSGKTLYQPNMTIENFKCIIDECKNKVFQIALGGRGD